MALTVKRPKGVMEAQCRIRMWHMKYESGFVPMKIRNAAVGNAGSPNYISGCTD